MYKSLRDYLSLLDRDGDLVTIKASVDPSLEMAEIADRVVKSGGKALLFTNNGTKFPVAMNLFGSEQRMARALGVESLDRLTEMVDDIVKGLMSPKVTLVDKLRALPMMMRLGRVMPRYSRSRGECQQVVLRGDEARLSLLPILKCWPHDGGRFVTLPLVHTIDPTTGVRNAGMYRMQVFSEKSAGLHWHMHKTGERHYQAWRAKGGRMPVAVALGGDPCYTYCATAPLPDGVDEYILAGVIRGSRVKLVRCVTNELYVPSDCDIVIEGYVDTTQQRVVEGPFGDHTGFYSLEDLYPVMHITAITHRRDAIYPATVVGVPPQEDAYIAVATEKLFLAPIRAAVQPEIEDLYMPAAGTAHNIAMVRIRTQYPAQGVKVASNLWGAGQMMFNKFMVVSGDDVRNVDTMARLLRGVDVGRDLLISRGVLDVLDHATATMGVGGKLLIDLTEPREPRELRLPESFDGAQVDSSLAQRWGVLIVQGQEPFDVKAFVERNKIEGINYIILTDSATKVLSPSELLWWCGANIEVGRDVTIVGDVVVADARTKREMSWPYPARYPNIVTSSRATAAMVDSRWGEYGLGDFVVSPSEHLRGLVFSDRAEI